MKVALHVIKAGSLTTVQDLGRQGVTERGFSVGGRHGSLRRTSRQCLGR
ncbi:MAG: hypothetical protein RL336_1292 [Pseudomonadota bacterium]|jgi:allophanate hydrolase subunit 2